MKNWLVFLVIVFLITGCSSSQNTGPNPASPTPTARPAPTAPPIPTLEPVTRFVEGESKIPADQKLFVAIKSSRNCSGECNCPVVEPPCPMYSIYDSGELQLDGDWGAQPLSPTIVGFLGFGEWNEQVYPIETLPFQSPDKQVIIHSVDAQGVVVAEIAGHFYYIKPGQGWSKSNDVKEEPPPGCHVVYTYRFFNHGLFSHSQINASQLFGTLQSKP